MKNLLRLEELAQFLVCIGLLIEHDAPWWVYLLLVLGPDIGMLGYLVGPRVGAISYDVLHHKGIALVVVGFAAWLSTLHYMSLPALLDHTSWLITGMVLYGHASMDRIFGYGLKFGDDFHHTHLGWIGKRKEQEQVH